MHDWLISLGNWVKLAILVVAVGWIVYICCTAEEPLSVDVRVKRIEELSFRRRAVLQEKTQRGHADAGRFEDFSNAVPLPNAPDETQSISKP